MVSLLSLLSLTFLLGGSHATDGYEWAGIFKIPSGTSSLVWRMQKVGGGILRGAAYAKPSMKMVILPIYQDDQDGENKNCTEANLHAVEATGWPAHKISADCTEQKNGNTLNPDMKACFNLVADNTASASLFKIDVTDMSCIAVFTEHDPEKLVQNRHYLDAERITDEL